MPDHAIGSRLVDAPLEDIHAPIVRSPFDVKANGTAIVLITTIIRQLLHRYPRPFARKQWFYSTMTTWTILSLCPRRLMLAGWVISTNTPTQISLTATMSPPIITLSALFRTSANSAMEHALAIPTQRHRLLPQYFHRLQLNLHLWFLAVHRCCQVTATAMVYLETSLAVILWISERTITTTKKTFQRLQQTL